MIRCKSFAICCLSLLSAAIWQIRPAELPHAGPLIDQFPLTLDIGSRTEALGPLFYDQEGEAQDVFALPPLFSHTSNSNLDSEEFDFAYPLLTYDRFGTEYRWQLVQLLSFAGGQNQDEISARRFTIFPFYFQQRSPDPEQNYTAFFPIYGHLQGRLFRSEIDFALWPLYVKTVRRPTVSSLPNAAFESPKYRFFKARRGDVTTYNYLYPIFHLRYGDGLKGWQFWPLVGSEHKDVTTRTNGFGEAEIVAGYDKFFALWPFYANNLTDVGTDNPKKTLTVLPFFNIERAPLRDTTGVLWPLFNVVDDREKKYHEWQTPWPIVIFARGEGKTTTRIWPFYSQAHNDTLESDFYLWPLYKYKSVHAPPLERERIRILFYLYSDVKERNSETSASRRRVDLWPFFTSHRDFEGNRRLQILAPLETFLPENKSIERDYSPLWSIWRYEKSPKNDRTSQSLLWNLYRRETHSGDKKCSLLFGLFQYQSGAGGKRLKLFYVPVVNKMNRSEVIFKPVPGFE